VLGGPDVGEFSIQLQPTSPVAASDTTTFIIRFSPTSAGVKTVTISIANNDSDENPYDITITGTGMEAQEDQPPSVFYLTGDVVNIYTDSSGRVLFTYVITSSDGKLTITIPAGTIALDENGNPLTTITIDIITNPPPPPPPPPGLNIILPAFSIQPNNSSFTPPITITIHYDDADIPPGVAEGDLKIGYYNESTGEWVVLEGTVNPLTNTITLTTGGFSYYTVAYETSTATITTGDSNLKQGEDGNQTTETTTPAPTSPTSPMVAPSTPVTTPSAPGSMTGYWIGGGIAAACIVFVLIIWRMVRKPD
jgi:hypothetical protein